MKIICKGYLVFKNLVMWHMVEHLKSKNETLPTKENKIKKNNCSKGHGLNNPKF
jgi:hypothetical protein